MLHIHMATYSMPTILSLLLFISVFSLILHNFPYTISNVEVLNIKNPRFVDRAHDHVISNRMGHIFWFIQVTDIHLSAFDDRSRTVDFRRFCLGSLQVIQPELVLVSGDLTDGKTRNKFGSRQYVEEWNTYNRILYETKAVNHTQWLDLRGNHDVFNVPHILHEENQFGKFGVQGPRHPKSYLFTLKKPFGNYSFIGLDACPSPGLKRPLNFFGSIDSDTQKTIHQLVEQAERSNQTFWFGHYPTSTIIAPNFDLRGVIGNIGFAYLCGHLHTFMDWVPRMYTVQAEGFLEWELGDWRDNRYYRIVAVDHDLVSFLDVQMLDKSGEWPVVLITNPKNANFLLPHKEPVWRIANSTHIRILAWSKWPIYTVSVVIDDLEMGNAFPALLDNSNAHSTALYVLPWNTSQFTSGSIHEITVHVRDVVGNERVVTQPFTIDGDPLWTNKFLPAFFLRANHGLNLQLCFCFSWLLLTTILSIPRCLTSMACRQLHHRSCFLNGLFRVSRSDQLFYPILVYLISQITCPIFMGYLLDDHFGVVFVFGIFVDGIFLRESLTYFQELIQMFFFSTLVLLPTILYAGTYRRQQVAWSNESTGLVAGSTVGSSQNPRIATHIRSSSCFGSIPVVLFLFSFIFTILQSIISIQTIAMPYGWLAFFLSPGRLSPLILSWWLTSRCRVALIPIVVQESSLR